MIHTQRGRYPGMLLLIFLLAALLLMPSTVRCQEAEQGDTTEKAVTVEQSAEAPQDSVPFAGDVEVEMFMKHLRGHWDDIHDVIMRYHLDDPFLKGQVVLSMIWQGTQLQSAEPLENTTENEAFAAALIAAMKPWKIAGLTGPCKLIVPLATRIVGSDDSTFADCAILTGTVKDAEGKALSEAKLVLFPDSANAAELPPTRTNREGVFIMTLISPGSWKLNCQLDGYEKVVSETIDLESGQHRRIDFVLDPKTE